VASASSLLHEVSEAVMAETASRAATASHMPFKFMFFFIFELS
jgi:hypothetical protein